MWIENEEGMFSVKSAYFILESIFLVEEGVGLEEGFFLQFGRVRHRPR